MTVFPGSETWRSGPTATESTATTSRLGSGTGSTPSTSSIGRNGRSTVSDSRRDVSASRLGSVGGSGKTSRRLLVSVTVHVGWSGVSGKVGLLRGGSLSSHVRRDIGRSGRVELDAVYLVSAWSCDMTLSRLARGKRDNVLNLFSSPVAPLASPIGPVVMLITGKVVVV